MIGARFVDRCQFPLSHCQTFENNTWTLHSHRHTAFDQQQLYMQPCLLMHALHHLSVSFIALTSRIWPSNFNVRLKSDWPALRGWTISYLPQGAILALLTEQNTRLGTDLFRVETKGLAFHLSVHIFIPVFKHIFGDLGTNNYKTCQFIVNLQYISVDTTIYYIYLTSI